jgi:hypothetical protein
MGGLLCRHDAGNPGGLERIAFLDRTRSNLANRLARHRDSPSGDGFAGRRRLVAHIDHPYRAAGADVGQFRLSTARLA